MNSILSVEVRILYLSSFGVTLTRLRLCGIIGDLKTLRRSPGSTWFLISYPMVFDHEWSADNAKPCAKSNAVLLGANTHSDQDVPLSGHWYHGPFAMACYIR